MRELKIDKYGYNLTKRINGQGVEGWLRVTCPKIRDMQCVDSHNPAHLCGDHCSWWDLHGGGIYCLNRPLGTLIDTDNPLYEDEVVSKRKIDPGTGPR